MFFPEHVAVVDEAERHWAAKAKGGAGVVRAATAET